MKRGGELWNHLDRRKGPRKGFPLVLVGILPEKMFSLYVYTLDRSEHASVTHTLTRDSLSRRSPADPNSKLPPS